MAWLFDSFVIQLIALFSYAAFWAGSLSTRDAITKVGIAIGCALLALHFLLLGSYEGAAVVALAGIRTICSIYWHRSNMIGGLFLTLTVGAVVISLDDMSGYFALCGGVLGVVAVFWLSGIKMRLMLAVMSAMWVVHNMIIGSWAGVAGEISVIMAHGWAIYHIHKKAGLTILPEAQIPEPIPARAGEETTPHS